MNTPTTPAAAESPVHPLIALTRGWDRFWFSTADPTLLGLVRIFCGLVTLYVHLAYCPDLREFFGARGWVDQPTITQFRNSAEWYALPADWNETVQWEPTSYGYYSWSIWYHVTDPTWMAVIHGAILVAMFLFTIGFCTRITSVLTWLGAISYIQRSPTTLFGMDTMMNLLLIYLMIGPSGAALSVDRFVARYFATRKALRKHQPAPGFWHPAPMVSANLALRLIQVNLCIIYFVSGLSKLKGDTWWSGTAIWLTVANPEFSPIHNVLYNSFLTFLCNHRLLWETLMSGGVLFTFFVEIGFPFLVWNRRTRWTMIGAAIAMHTGIALSMRLRTFSLFMLVMDLSFLPPEAVDRGLRWLGRNTSRFRLSFSNPAPGLVRAASLVHAFDVWEQVEIAEAMAGHQSRHAGEVPLVRPAVTPRSKHITGENQPLRLITSQDEVLTGYAVFERLVRSLPLLWPAAPLTFIPGVASLGQRYFPGSKGGGNIPFTSDIQGRKTTEEKVSR